MAKALPADGDPWQSPGPSPMLLPLASLLLADYGLAFLLGAVALVFKRVQQFWAQPQKRWRQRR